MRELWLTGVGTMLLAVLVACGGEASPEIPSSPTNVAATAGPGYITVSWEDKSDNETGFVIYRDGDEADKLSHQQSGTKVGTVGADETTYIDQDITIGQSFSYSVVAKNAEGASAAATAAQTATVVQGVDLMVGTNNRRHSDIDNGTIFVVYYVFPKDILEDADTPFEVTITGPDGWNDGEGLTFAATSEWFGRDRGFTYRSVNEITALEGEYKLTVVAGGETYEATDILEDPLFKFPRPTDMKVTASSSSSVSVSWTEPAGTKSSSLSVWRDSYEEQLTFYELEETSNHIFEDLELSDGLYQVEIVAHSVDLNTFPLKEKPFGSSYGTVSFAIGDEPSPLCQSPDEGVSIPDGNLEQAVRDALNKSSGDLTCKDMVALTELEIAGHAIENLEGLQSAVNLVSLDLRENAVIDIAPILGLVTLKDLALNRNPIVSISGLSTLSKLEELSIESLGLGNADLAELEPLTELRYLGLEDNGISDLSVISTLTNLATLELQENQLTDISPLLSSSGLGEGDRVVLKDNFLDLSEGSDDLANIRTLQGRGVELEYEPQNDPDQAQERCKDWDRFRVGPYLYHNNMWVKGDVSDYEQCLMRRLIDGAL